MRGKRWYRRPLFYRYRRRRLVQAARHPAVQTPEPLPSWAWPPVVIGSLVLFAIIVSPWLAAFYGVLALLIHWIRRSAERVGDELWAKR